MTTPRSADILVHRDPMDHPIPLPCFDLQLRSAHDFSVELPQLRHHLDRLADFITQFIGAEPDSFRAFGQIACDSPAKQLSPEAMMESVPLPITQLISQRRCQINNAPRANVMPGEETS